MGRFEPKLSESIIAHLEHIQTKYFVLRENLDYLDGLFYDGAIAANSIASKTLNFIKVAMGFARII